MEHTHSHHHAHHHTPQLDNLNRAFIVGIVINALYVLVELGAGLYYNSLSLMSDAGHNLSDVAALALALLAFRLSKIKSSHKFTYGFRKSTILVSLINSVILFIAIGIILWESIHRISNPLQIEGVPIIVVAGIGILVNVISALMFFKGKENDLNVKGAYLHLMADAAVSLGVVISGIFISLFALYWLDLVMSLIIVIVIFYSTWNLFKDSLSLSLDGVPKGIDMKEVMDEIKSVEGVIEVHHVHIWAISTSQNAITAHISIAAETEIDQLSVIKSQIKHELQHVNIQHATLEFELENEACDENYTNSSRCI